MSFELSSIKRKSFSIKLFIIIVLGVYVFLFYLCHEVLFPEKGFTNVKLSYVVVHLDLKGAPPKLSYLQFLLPTLKYNGVNGLLIEYEDMFPYQEKLVNLSATNCYDEANLKKFLTEAVNFGFEIIPLIQTFGHLEFALKLQEFRHLRELPDYADSLCPSNFKSKILLEEMLKQVVNFHNSIKPLKYIHLGCDEVFHMNKCERCKKRGLSNEYIFVDHLQYLSNFITYYSPGTTVLIWDDMLRKLEQGKWINISQLDNIEPVYWNYGAQLTNGVMPSAHLSFLNYHRKFKNIWAASAFKGANGPTATIPNLQSRLLNHFDWMKLLLNLKIAGETKVFDFKGFILTGWSRYSHMSPICELLPVSIPSLILNLRMVRKFKSGFNSNDLESLKDLHEFFSKYLIENDIHFKCDTILNTEEVNSATCFFEGSKLFIIFSQYLKFINYAIKYLHSDIDWSSSQEYYIQSKHCNFNVLLEKTNALNAMLKQLENMESKMNKAMTKYYKDDVVKEYVPFKTFYVKKEISHILRVIQTYMSFDRVWERRPIGNFTEPLMNISSILYSKKLHC